MSFYNGVVFFSKGEYVCGGSELGSFHNGVIHSFFMGTLGRKVIFFFLEG